MGTTLHWNGVIYTSDLSLETLEDETFSIIVFILQHPLA